MQHKRATPQVLYSGLNSWLNNYFGFTKREFNALLVLFGLTMFAFVTPYGYELLFYIEEPINDFDKNAIQQLSLIEKREKEFSNFNSKENSTHTKNTLFTFDPNLISVQTWEKLGLSTKQAQSILNYRNKGGKFYKIEDLKKMYAISPQQFERLQPYIQIESVAFKEQKKNNEKVNGYSKRELTIVELNSADTIKLDEIRGIGAAFARRIANYRDRLGGFYKKEQLREVFGLDSAKFEEIKSQIHVDASTIKKINLNTADFETLKMHPYLKYKQINAILQYRKQHGNYSSIADLKKVLILTPQTIEQIAPYLQF